MQAVTIRFWNRVKKLNVKPPETRGLGRSVQIGYGCSYFRISSRTLKGWKSRRQSTLGRPPDMENTSVRSRSTKTSQFGNLAERFYDHVAYQFGINRIIPVVNYTDEHSQTIINQFYLVIKFQTDWEQWLPLNHSTLRLIYVTLPYYSLIFRMRSWQDSLWRSENNISKCCH